MISIDERDVYLTTHLSRERLRMIRLDNCIILQLRHLVRNRREGTHDSFSIQNRSISRLHMFKSQVMCHVNNEHLAQLDLIETRVSRRTQYPLEPEWIKDI
jgi:hypothetical protein